MIGMLALAKLQDARVDLHGVDGLDLVGEGIRGVRPASGADDERVPEAPARKPLVDLIVEGLGRGRVDVYRMHRLVRDPVHRDRRIRSRRALHADPVVGRPEIATGRRADHESAGRDDECAVDDGEAAQRIRERAAGQQGSEDAEPDRRLRAQDGEAGEERDAADRPGDIEGVRAERGHRAEERAERQRERAHHRGDEDEDEREHQEVRVGRVALRESEENLVARADLHVQLRAQDQGDDEQKQHREG